MIASLLCAAMLQGTPLQRAESLLVAGDSAQAVDILKGSLRDTTRGNELLAAIALQWIGRGSQSWAGDARSAWRDPKRDWSDDDVATIVEELVANEDKHLASVVADSAFNRLVQGVDRLDPTRRGAVKWTLSQRALRVFARRFPTQVFKAANHEGHWARVHSIITADDTLTRFIAEARAHLVGALDGPWPLPDIAARSLVALAIFQRDSAVTGATRTELQPVALNRWTRFEVDAALLELKLQHDTLNQMFEANKDLVGRYDSTLSALGSRGQLPPDLLWRTGWPLYLFSFNERLVAHRVRFLLADLLQRYTPPDPTMESYGDPLLLVRRGLPATVEMAKQDRLGLSYDSRGVETLIAAHVDSGEPVSVDVGLAARDPARPRGPTGYQSQFFDFLVDLPHQLISYVRNGRPMVDFYGNPPTVAHCDPQRVTGFFLMDDHLVAVRKSVDSAAAIQPLHYSMELTPGQYVYSIESLDRGCRVASRARYTFRVLLPPRFALSTDVALATEVRGGVVQRVNGPLPITPLAGVSVKRGQAINLYWEVYGVAASEREPDRLMVDVSAADLREKAVPVQELSLVQRDTHTAKAAGQVHWLSEVPPGTDPIGMSLALKMPEDHSGVVVIRVKVTDQKTMRTAESQRTFLIVP